MLRSAPGRPAALAAMLLVVLIWGLNFTVSKWSLARIPPLAFTALRFTMASALLLAVLWRVEGVLAMPRRAFPALLGLGLLGNSIYQFGFIWGLDLSTASNSALVLAAMPATVAGLGVLLGIERLTPAGRRGLGLASVGVVLVVASHGIHFSPRGLAGDGLTLVAVVCWALFTLGVRRLDPALSPLAITTWTIVLGTPVLLVAGVPDLLRMGWAAVGWAGWGGVVYSSAASLVLGYIIWNWSVRVVGTNRTAIFTCMSPIFAMASAALVLGERPGPAQILGGAAVIAGVILAQRGELPAPPRPETPAS